MAICIPRNSQKLIEDWAYFLFRVEARRPRRVINEVIRYYPSKILCVAPRLATKGGFSYFKRNLVANSLKIVRKRVSLQIKKCWPSALRLQRLADSLARSLNLLLTTVRCLHRIQAASFTSSLQIMSTRTKLTPERQSNLPWLDFITFHPQCLLTYPSTNLSPY